MAIDDNIVIDRTSEQLINAIDITDGSSATGENATALGNQSKATGSSSVAIGILAETKDTGDIAIGGSSKAKNGGQAVGSGAEASGNMALAIGQFSKATGQNSIAHGNSANATARNAIQIGEGTNDDKNTVKIRNTTILDATGKIPFSALQGGEVVGLSVNSNNHLIVTYADGTTADLGAIGGGGTSDYTQLTNKPSVNGTTLIGSKTSADLKLLTVELLPDEFLQYEGGFLEEMLDDDSLPNGVFTAAEDEFFSFVINNDDDKVHTVNDKSIFFFDKKTHSACLIGGKYPFFVLDGSGGTFVTRMELLVLTDFSPQSGSENFITSGGVYTALSGKQNTLVFDSAPTNGSNNPVTSAGIKTYVDTAVGDIETALTGLISGGGVK